MMFDINNSKFNSHCITKYGAISETTYDKIKTKYVQNSINLAKCIDERIFWQTKSNEVFEFYHTIMKQF